MALKKANAPVVIARKRPWATSGTIRSPFRPPNLGQPLTMHRLAPLSSLLKIKPKEF